MSVSSGVSYIPELDRTEAYALNDLSGDDPMYIGKAAVTGKWLIQLFSPASGTMRYANVSNNSTYRTYADAWASKAALTYGNYELLSGV